MIATCPQCAAQFALPPGAVGPEGRRVKCSKCAHIWHQMPLEKLAGAAAIQPPPEKKAPVPPGGNLPALRKTGASAWLKAACIVSCLLAGLAGAARYHEHLPAVESFLGMTRTGGLMFKDFSAGKKRVDNHLEFLIRGSIVNRGAETGAVPDIRVTVLSKGGREMGTARIIPGERVLAPGASLPVGTEITRVSGNADTIVLDMGSPWELFFRPQARESVAAAAAAEAR